MDAMFEKFIESLDVAKLYTKGWFIASNVNHQSHTYYSYKPDPETSGVDALTADWSSLRFYAFPPFSIIPKVLKKIKTENAEGILVVPFWPNQPWFPLVFKMLTDAPVLLTSRKHLLHLPQHPETVHPIWRKINLLICHLAGSSQKAVGYLEKLQASSKLPRDHQQSKDIRATCTSSHTIAYNGILVPLKQISK